MDGLKSHMDFNPSFRMSQMLQDPCCLHLQVVNVYVNAMSPTFLFHSDMSSMTLEWDAAGTEETIRKKSPRLIDEEERKQLERTESQNTLYR